MSYSRYAVYYLPRNGALAAFGARWLGWDAAAGRAVGQPDLPGLAALTDAPRRYGFHATLKPPFRLSEGQDAAALQEAVRALAARSAPGQAAGLALTRMGRFFALTPTGDATEIARVAAACVRDLDGFRAAPSEAELARRRKAGLSPRQEALLRDWGYPYVLDAFRFHMTLTGRVPRAALEDTEAMIAAHLPALPAPFVLDALAVMGERADGRFEMIARYDLGG
ncbi:DUF1045 domain-containing protein [Roseovarius aestuariivivens]|uniref:DUF1045 domain-containing protein n=1 Tax=Roseovarius aestuariivivens TaxID=1888910 RepID=UPI0010821AFF|nr:DUF1045 domain-containing protein [Roseovarius aestuariivivens]